MDDGAKGYLDPRIVKMIGIDNKSCRQKSSKSCFLRRGVSVSNEPVRQSFIASLAHLNTETKNYNIKKMKNYMIGKMTIEHFVTMQNGNLVDIFYDADIGQDTEGQDTQKDTTKLWEKIQELSGNEGNAYYEKVKRSFKNFKDFLDDDSVLIDHTYLWDFVCMPGVFDKKGVNLVILELQDEESNMTNHINILCPTNHYATSVFDASKKTAILLKNKSNFEPMFQKKEKEELYLFGDLTDSALKTTLQKIKVMMSEGCRPTKGLPSYTFEQNIPYIKLVGELNQLKDTQGNIIYTKSKNVLNYTGKIVGIMVRFNTENGTEEVKGEEQEMNTEEFFVPCRPSPLMHYDENNELQITNNIWLHEVDSHSYNATRNFLQTISEASDGAIKSKPLVKIADDDSGDITGILTETDQYVPVIPTQTTTDELPINKHMDYIHLEKVSTTNTDKLGNRDNRDNQGDKTYLAIITEAKLYTMFRTTLRVLLDYDDDNQGPKKQMEDIIISQDGYYDKLKKLIPLLRSAMSDHVKFVDEYEITDPTALKPCVKTKTSLLSECKIEIPKKNLFNGLDNEETYFGRIADELVRYYVLRTFILSNDMEEPIVLLPTVNAVLNKDEMIVGINQLDEMIKVANFKSLKPKETNKFKKYNSHDMETHNANEKENPEDVQKLSRMSVDYVWKDVQQ